MSICDIPGVSTVCTAIGEGPAGLFFGWIASAMGLAVSTLFQGMWDVFSTTTSVDVTSDGYVKVYNILFGKDAIGYEGELNVDGRPDGDPLDTTPGTRDTVAAADHRGEYPNVSAQTEA